VEPEGRDVKRSERIGWLLVSAAAVLVLVGRGPGVPLAPAPISAPGFRALIVEEVENRHRLPPGQLAALTSQGPGSLREYLKTHCAPGPDGKTPDATILDDDDTVELMPEYWRGVYEQRPREGLGEARGLPWWILSNGSTGVVGSLPTDEPSIVGAAKQVGGE
jgi:hypothetical protein